MKLYQKIAAGVLAATSLAGLWSCDALEDAKARYKENESAIIKTIEETSPFIQTPVKSLLPEKERKREWYQDFTFVPVNSNDIVYEKMGNLYLAKNKDKKQSQQIAKDIHLNQKYLFAFGTKNQENQDIYWIDSKGFYEKYDLRKLKNNNGKFEDEGILLSLKDYFKSLPRYLELGDINSDGQPDIIYGDNIKIGRYDRNAIKAFIGDGKTLKDIGTVYYLGSGGLGGLIARDVDGDGDSDLIFKLQGNDKELFGLENKTKESINPAIFQDGFRDKVSNDNMLLPLLFYYFFIMRPMQTQ
jgi:hypothetical protein